MMGVGVVGVLAPPVAPVTPSADVFTPLTVPLATVPVPVPVVVTGPAANMGAAVGDSQWKGGSLKVTGCFPLPGVPPTTGRPTAPPKPPSFPLFLFLGSPLPLPLFLFLLLFSGVVTFPFPSVGFLGGTFFWGLPFFGCFTSRTGKGTGAFLG